MGVCLCLTDGLIDGVKNVGYKRRDKKKEAIISKFNLLSCWRPDKHLFVLWFDANKLCLVCTFLLKYELVSTP